MSLFVLCKQQYTVCYLQLSRYLELELSHPSYNLLVLGQSVPCDSSVVAVTITRTTSMKSNDLLFETVVDAVTMRALSGSQKYRL